MVHDVSITILIDNEVNDPRFQNAHGLSLVLTWKEDGLRHQVILDTGPHPDILRHNLDALDPDLSDLRAIVLSHGHYDHTSGLLALLERLPGKMPVIVHPEAFNPKFRQFPFLKYIGPPFSRSQAQAAGAILVEAKGPVPITPSVYSTGAIPRVELLETPKHFVKYKDHEIVPDLIDDDLSLVVMLNRDELVVLTGCCHAGLINTLNRVVASGQKVKALIGGFHLLDAEPERLQATSAFLSRLDPELIIPLHCTGHDSAAYLARGLPGRVQFSGAGSVIYIS